MVSLVSTTGVDADLVNPFASIELNEKKANYMIYLFANVLISYFSRTFFIRLHCLKFYRYQNLIQILYFS